MRMHASVEALVRDARHAWRAIARTPSFAIMVVATLALGVGANSAMFSLLDRIFLRPPSGIRDPASLRRVWLHRSNVHQTLMSQLMSYPQYVALRDNAVSSGAQIALYTTSDGMRIGRDRDAPPVHGVFATANYFDVLGVRPARGRVFAPDEDRMGAGADVIVISDIFWKTRLDGDAAIIGKQISLGLIPYTVVGILPEDFVGLDLQAADVWIPLGAFRGRPQGHDRKPWYETSTTYGARAIIRVPPGMSEDAFAAQATVVVQRAQDAFDDRVPTRIAVQTGSIISARGPGDLAPETRIATRVAGVALIVLLIATANVVNLLLARANRRRQEIAVRLALGVSRARLIRMLTTESLLLALLAGIGAILTAWWGGAMLRSILLPDVEWIDSGLDGRVTLFSLAVALVAGFVAGIIPAIQASNPQLATMLKSGARDGFVSRSRLRSGLVVVQAAFSVVLLVGASLFIRSLRNVQGIDIGYDIQQTVSAEVMFESGEEPPGPALDAAIREIAARLEGRPGVEKVGRAAIAPMRGYGMQMYFADQAARASFYSSDFGPLFSSVSPGFFEASGLRLLRGRVLGGNEYAGPGTAPNEVVANEIAARTLYPGEEPLGKCIRFGKPENPCHTIVGIVEDANSRGVIESKMGHFYAALGSAASGERTGASIVVRTGRGATDAVATELRREIKQAFPLGHPMIFTMTETLEQDYRRWRIGATLFGWFSALALLVALVGIYSSVSYMVGQRTREFGVRIALGAHTREVLNHVIEEALRVVAVGVALGVVLALAGARLVQSFLFGVEADDPSALLLASCALLIVAAVAALVPALRAAKVDPVVALRAE